MPSFRFYHPIEIRYGDLDPQGHVNNARYLTYFEQARIAYVRQLGLWQVGSFMEIGFILATAELTFLVPVHYGWPVEVGVRVCRLGTKSMTMEYQLEDGRDRQALCQGSSVLVTYNYHDRQTIPVPETWRVKILDFEGPLECTDS